MQTAQPQETRAELSGEEPIPLLRLPYVMPDVLAELSRLRSELIELKKELESMRTELADRKIAATR